MPILVYNEMIDELTKAFGETIVNDSSAITVLWGCVNTGTGTNIGDSAIISAGAVYFNSEVYQVPAFSTASIVSGLKGTITTGYATGSKQRITQRIRCRNRSTAANQRHRHLVP